MARPDTDQAREARGRKAEREYEELSAAFDAVEQALRKAFDETPIGADSKVLKLHMSIHNLAALRVAIEKTIVEGKAAGAYLRAAEDAIAEEGLTRP